MNCTISSCAGKHYARRLCRIHYKRARDQGRLPSRIRLKPGEVMICSVQGCINKHHARRLCYNHYQKWIQTGTLKPLRAPNGAGTVSTGGYRVLHSSGRRTTEHRLVVEQILGRRLQTAELVHHLNGNRLDNRPKNLQLMTQSQHTKLHVAQRRNRQASLDAP